jgi:hypothetical protein
VNGHATSLAADPGRVLLVPGCLPGSPAEQKTFAVWRALRHPDTFGLERVPVAGEQGLLGVGIVLILGGIAEGRDDLLRELPLRYRKLVENFSPLESPGFALAVPEQHGAEFRIAVRNSSSLAGRPRNTPRSTSK